MSGNIKETVVNALHKPARRNYPRRKTIVKGLNDPWQIDLVEMKPYSKFNKGYRYILVAINAFSKYVWAEPLKSKKGKAVSIAMKRILEKTTKPTNRGTEFVNTDFKKLMNLYQIKLL